MRKVSLMDKSLIKNFQEKISFISTVVSLALIFFEIPTNLKIGAAIVFSISLIIFYLIMWASANMLQAVELNIEGSLVTVKVGDIFKERGWKVISFNEYFDTVVDNKMISEHSLNGIFINQHLSMSRTQLDAHISSYSFEEDERSTVNAERPAGKKQKYNVGTLCVCEDYLLAAFAKFDKDNRAILTMPEYLEFLINFWDRINKVYAQQSVSVPIFGSGITRIKEHKNISDEDLLKIMLWTFRISEMRFKHPAKLSIIIHKDKISRINLLDIKSAKNGL